MRASTPPLPRRGILFGCCAPLGHLLRSLIDGLSACDQLAGNTEDVGKQVFDRLSDVGTKAGNRGACVGHTAIGVQAERAAVIPQNPVSTQPVIRGHAVLCVIYEKQQVAVPRRYCKTIWSNFPPIAQCASPLPEDKLRGSRA